MLLLPELRELISMIVICWTVHSDVVWHMQFQEQTLIDGKHADMASIKQHLDQNILFFKL